MKTMSPGEQIKLLKDGRKKLRDLSTKGRKAAAQQVAQQNAQQDAQEQAQKRPTRISVYDRYVR